MTREQEQRGPEQPQEEQTPVINLADLAIHLHPITPGMETPTGISERLNLDPTKLIRIANPLADLTPFAIPVARRLLRIQQIGNFDDVKMGILLPDGAVGLLHASRKTAESGEFFEATENLRRNEEADHYFEKTADWEGLVYTQAKENDPPLAQTGDKVTADQRVLHWFVTKDVDGPVYAGQDGIIELLVANGDPITAGNLGIEEDPEKQIQPTILFRIRPVVSGNQTAKK